jgi:hypothetical protein
MEWLIHHFYSYGIILQAVAIVHFIRRRPETYWLFIILIGGWLGAAVYIFAEVVPDLGLMRGAFQVFPRRKRIRELEAMVLDNPSAGNYEELADLYLTDGKFARAHECYDKAISSRTDSPDPFYRRGVCALELGDYQAATDDLERRGPLRSQVRLPARLRPAGARPGQDRPDGARRQTLRGSDARLHSLRDAVQLRLLPCGPGADAGGARVGATRAFEKAHHARVPAAARAAVVPQSGGAA